MKNIKEDIRTGNFKRIYLLYGEEDYLVRMYRENIMNAALGGDTTGMNYNAFKGAGQDVPTIREIIMTMPFFADRRVVMLDDTGLFGADSGFAEILPDIPDSTVVIMSESKVDKRSKLFKDIKKYGYECEFTALKPEETAQFVASRLGKAGKKITREDCQYFVDNVGGDMYNVVSETEKLVSYVGERDVVARQDIDAVCVMQVENRIFDLVDALVHGRRGQALKIYFDLIALRESPIGILRFMQRQYMKLSAIQELYAKGMSDAEVASAMHMADWLARKNRQQIRGVSTASLKNAVRMCTEAEVDFKSGNLNDTTAIEILLANLSAV